MSSPARKPRPAPGRVASANPLALSVAPSGDAIDTLYGPALSITDRQLALRYLEELCVQLVTLHGVNTDDALRVARENLGYLAAYYGHEMRERVEDLFGAVHPIFGPVSSGPVSPERAFALGQLKALGGELVDAPRGKPGSGASSH